MAGLHLTSLQILSLRFSKNRNQERRSGKISSPRSKEFKPYRRNPQPTVTPLKNPIPAKERTCCTNESVGVRSEWSLIKAQAFFAEALAPGRAGEVFQGVLRGQLLKLDEYVPDLALVADRLFEPIELFRA